MRKNLSSTTHNPSDLGNHFRTRVTLRARPLARIRLPPRDFFVGAVICRGWEDQRAEPMHRLALLLVWQSIITAIVWQLLLVEASMTV